MSRYAGLLRLLQLAKRPCRVGGSRPGCLYLLLSLFVFLLIIILCCSFVYVIVCLIVSGGEQAEISGPRKETMTRTRDWNNFEGLYTITVPQRGIRKGGSEKGHF